MRRSVVMLAVLLAPLAVCQDLRVSLPLNGAYRRGQFMPVRVTGGSGSLEVSAEGAVPTECPRRGQDEVLLPLLIMTSTSAEVTVRDAAGNTARAGPLHVIPADERLVGVVGGDDPSLGSLYPGMKVTTIPLDASVLVERWATAWDALDAIVLDSPNPQLEQSLAALGVAVAVKSRSAPAGNWHWLQEGAYWVSTPLRAGPESAEMNVENYAPSIGREQEEPRAARQLVVLGGALFALLVIGAALLAPPRTAIPTIAMLAVLTTIGVILVARSGAPSIVQSMIICVQSKDLMQEDRWVYARSWQGAHSFQYRIIGELGYPLLLNEREIDGLQMRLLCQQDGGPVSYRLQIPPKRTVGFLSRSVATHGNVTVYANAPALYLSWLNERYASPTTTYVGDSSFGFIYRRE